MGVAQLVSEPPKKVLEYCHSKTTSGAVGLYSREVETVRSYCISGTDL